MIELHYHLLDVFTSEPFGGNPLAVFPNADGIDTATMGRIANELNLSETTFIQSPKNPASDCTVRIFTPKREIPMAGHPTIGTAYAILKNGILKPKHASHLLLDEGVGQIKVDIDETNATSLKLMMNQPKPTFFECLDKATIASTLSLQTEEIDSDLPVQIVSCGMPFIIVPLKSMESVKRAVPRPDLMSLKLADQRSQEILIYSKETVRPESDLHCRMFAPRFGVPEDPATGSAHGPLGSYLFKHDQFRAGKLTSEQGYEMGRESEIILEIRGNENEITNVIVGGNSVEMGSGSIRIKDAGIEKTDNKEWSDSPRNRSTLNKDFTRLRKDPVSIDE